MPTAGHQARAGGTLYIFTGPGLASCRRRPLSSNVRQHTGHTVAASAESAAHSAENVNSREVAKPPCTVSTLPRLRQLLATAASECQRRPPPQAPQLSLAPAAEEARALAAHRRGLSSHARCQSVRSPTAAGNDAASPSRVSGGEMTVTTKVARTGSRFGNRERVVFSVRKAISPPRSE